MNLPDVRLRPLVLFVLVLALVAPLAAAIPPAGAVSDIGYAGPSTSGAGTAPTGEKPESKLWWNDGRWWASMFSSSAGTWHIWYLDRVNHAWVDTGVPIDDRPAARADALWDGTHLYVASAMKASSNTTETVGQPARLYRYSYDGSTRTYSLDAGFPVAINNISSETITLDKDSTGRLWATWTQNQAVFVNATIGSDTSWGTPFPLTVDGASGVDPDDISTLTTFGGKTGVLWSNQATTNVYFSTHDDSASVNTWSASVVVTPPGPYADDHLNIRTLQSDNSGRVFAVLKTSMDTASNSQAPQVVLAARDISTGKWSIAPVWTVADCPTRPILELDSTNNLLHIYATAPEGSCPYTGTPGTIFEKTSPMDKLSFVSGKGTPVMRDSTSATLNNVTGSKQTVNATTGIVLLAASDTTNRYWSSDESLDHSAPTVTSTSPSSGASGVPTSTAVSATFSEPVDPTTVTTSTFQLAGVTGTVTYSSATQTATFLPSSALAAGTGYTATVNGVKDLAGNAMTTAKTWSFTTVATSPPTTVTVTPIADTYVRSDTPTTNYGTATRVDVDGDPIQISYLKYDLSAYAGKTITSATLKVRVTDTGSSGTQNVKVVSDSTWSETGMLYGNRPALGASVVGTLGPTNTNTNYTITLTGSALQSALGGLLSIGFDSTNADGVHIASRETSTPAVLVLTLS